MQYQTFGEVKGSSDSVQKLGKLRLPSLEGKHVLDVGCNEGFFCGFALFDGAASVTGIDKSRESTHKAQIRFPEANILNQSWSDLPEGPFDIITMLSALHYEDDQEALIHRLMSLLSDEGTLVLEMGIAPGGKPEWKEVERSVDTRRFPTRRMVGQLLDAYAWKIVNRSVEQKGDPVPRYVVHVQKLKPYVALLMQNPGMGKTTISRRLFSKGDIPVLSGDGFYRRISEGKYAESETITAIVQEMFSTTGLGDLTSRILNEGLAKELVALWIRVQERKDFVLDCFIPESYRATIIEEFSQQGYFPVHLDWINDNGLTPLHLSQDRANAYEKRLRYDGLSLESTSQAKVKKLYPSRSKKVSWHLDSPVDGEFAVLDFPLRISGWLYAPEYAPEDISVVVESSDSFKETTLQKTRHDVLAFLKEDGVELDPRWREGALVGFSLKMPGEALSDGMTVKVRLKEREISLADIRIAKSREGFSEKLKKRLFGG